MFGATDGVLRTRVGYTGGEYTDPTYENIGDHAESVDIEYNSDVINYQRLLQIFWQNHDPTFSCRTQYMSAIFYHDKEQQRLAEESLEAEQSKTIVPITTCILRAGPFYEAENYHQKYLLRRYPYVMEQLNLSPDKVVHSSLTTRLNGYLGGYGDLHVLEMEAEDLGISQDLFDYIVDQRSSTPSRSSQCLIS